jgi:phospholipid/cholesterol/gamma-HCH transport system permease protein
MSAYIFANIMYDVSTYSFFSNMRAFFDPIDIWIGLCKAFIFGFMIVSIANFTGSKTKGGADGVGLATANTVVYSCISILIMNFIVTKVIIG